MRLIVLLCTVFACFSCSRKDDNKKSDISESRNYLSLESGENKLLLYSLDSAYLRTDRDNELSVTFSKNDRERVHSFLKTCEGSVKFGVNGQTISSTNYHGDSIENGLTLGHLDPDDGALSILRTLSTNGVEIIDDNGTNEPRGLMETMNTIFSTQPSEQPSDGQSEKQR